MKKILFIMNDLGGGGAEKVFIDILHHFDYTKYEIKLLLIRHQGIYINNLPKEVELISIYDDEPIANKICSKEQWRYRRFGIKYFIKKRIPKKILNTKFDSIISFLEGYPVVYHSLLMNNTKNNVSWVHADLNACHWTKSIFHKDDEHMIYKNMNHIIHVSEETNAQFQKLFSNCNNHVIHNLIDKEKICQLADISEKEYTKFTVCSVGRLTDIKAFSRIMPIARNLLNDGYDIDFNIIGDGEEKDVLLNQIQQMKLENNVHLLGFKKPPYPYMKNSKIFLSVSKTEGYPLVLCEALCLGIPIISTKTSGAIEILNNEYGIVVEHNIDAITNAIKHLYDNPQEYEKYRKLSKKRSEDFDVQKTMEKIYNIL